MVFKIYNFLTLIKIKKPPPIQKSEGALGICLS